MVKVQKPQPKTLSKSSKLEGVVKDKPKQSKSKKAAKTVASVDVAEIKKVAVKKLEIKKEKSKPAVAPKTPKAKKEKPVAVKPAPKSKPAKKPLILAPPESPAAPAPKVSKKGAAATKKVTTQKENVPEKKTVKAVVEKKSKENVAKKPAKQQQQVKTEKPTKASKAAVAADKTAKKPLKPVQTKQPELAKSAKKPAKKQVDAKVKPVTKKVAKAVVGKAKVAKGKTAKKGKVSEKPAPKVVELNYELKPFDEDKFNEILAKKNVQKVCEALKTQVADEVQKRQKAIFSDYRFVLQVCSYKISSCPKRMVKLALKHSLIGVDDDVAVIVTDLQRGARVDSEPTVQHYEDLFREAGIKQRLTVVPFNLLRNDMGSFEAKRKFVNTYDYLLCDGRISGQTTAFLGQCAQKSRNVLHAIRLSKRDQLEKEFTRALCRTAYRQLGKGDLTAIPIGNHEQSSQQLAENILTVVQQLQQQFPGGLANIRSMYLKIDIGGTSALPLYVSMCAPPADTPYVVGPREQRMLKLKKQANEVLSKFALTKDVDFIKLTSTQVKRKAELREKRDALKAEDALKDKEEGDEPVPAKKARKNATEEAVESNDDAANSDEEDDDDEEVADGEDDDDEGDDDEDNDDDDDAEDDDDDAEEDEDDDEDEEDDE